MYHDRSAAWLAGGMVAAALLLSGSCLAAGGVAAAARADASLAAGSSATFDLGQLMKLLGQRRQGEVTYEQEDYFAILDQPVPSSGVLIYRAPDRLEKRTLRPKATSLVVVGDELTVQRGQRTYRMQLSAYPQVAPLVEAMRDTLAGNEEGLERVFKVKLSGSLQNWKLGLVPLDKEVARKVSAVQIAGKRDEIRSVEILQVGGDRSVMTLGPPPARGAAGTDPAPAPP
jgi:outer membrane lipoprotein carrier protein LolA